MEEKKCKYCAMMIPKDAKICPHCRKKQNTGFLIGFAVVIFILIIIGMINSPSQTDTSISKEDLPKLAFYKSQEYVTNNLKAPATADFPYYISDYVKRVAGDDRGAMFEVQSYVDAQNSFGAKIRTHYKCTLVRVYNNNTWVLAELKTW